MSWKNKIFDVLVDKAASILGTSTAWLLAFISTTIVPIILPYLEDKLKKEFLLRMLIVSTSLNVILSIIFWLFFKKSQLNLKYGMYWDSKKNPYCPICKIPVGSYGNYNYSTTKGYYCKKCKTVHEISDACGNNIEPSKVLSEL